MGERLGVSREVVANWESNRTEIPEDQAKKVGKIYDKPVDWFYDGEDLPGERVVLEERKGYDTNPAPGFDPPNPMGSKDMHPASGRRLYPVLGTAAAAAAPLISSEYVDDYIDFSDDLYRPERYAIRVEGDSMEKAIKEKDYILVQPAAFLYEHQIAVIRSDEFEFAVKNYEIHNGQPLLVPENPAYQPIRPGDGWVIAGYAVGWKRVFGPRSYAEVGHDSGLRVKQNLHIVPFDL